MTEPRQLASTSSATTPAAWGLPLAVMVVGVFVSVLDTTIVNVAVPAIQKDFGGSLPDVLWIATSYTLTLGVVVPISSWLGDRFGLSRVYLVALLAFAAGSALCGLAWNLNVLIAFRILQAVPGGILPVITLTMVYRIVPKDKIGAAMGMYGLGIVVAPALGPVLGGYLVQYADWRLVFFINVPIGLLGALAAYLLVPKIGKAVAHRFDLAGFATVAYGLFAVLLAASKGEDWGWTGYRVLALLISGTLSLALFVVIELEVADPLLDLRVLKVWPFTNSLLLLTLLTVNLLAVAFYIPVFLQQGRGLQAFEAGLLTMPQALVMGALMPIAGRVYDKIGPRWLAAIGLTICAYGTYLMGGLTPDTTNTEIVIWTCVRAFGMGLAMMPIMTSGLAAVPAALTNQASAMNNVARQVAGSLGLAGFAVLATAQQTQMFSDRATLTPATAAGAASSGAGFAPLYQRFQHLNLEVLAASYADLFLITAGLAVLGAIGALLLRSGPAAPTSAPAPRADPTVAPPLAAGSANPVVDEPTGGERVREAADQPTASPHRPSSTRSRQPVGHARR
ncbi:MAG: multidrug efflux MFS transporter [Actinomycetota bacterium]|nr:multidrug efflux MFS transporter [Actinomycetota bacterium]